MTQFELKQKLDVLAETTHPAHVSMLLNEIYRDITTSLIKDTKDCLVNAATFQRTLNLLSNRSAGRSAFLLGKYHTLTEHAISNYREKQSHRIANKIMSDANAQYLAQFFYKNGMTKQNVLRTNISLSEDVLKKTIDDMERAGLLSIHYLPSETYYDLTVAGYTYVTKHYSQGKEWHIW